MHRAVLWLHHLETRCRTPHLAAGAWQPVCLSLILAACCLSDPLRLLHAPYWSQKECPQQLPAEWCQMVLAAWPLQVGAKVMLDCCQSVPHMAVDVQQLGADWIVASGHKMVGPTGSAFLWGRCAAPCACRVRHIAVQHCSAALTCVEGDLGAPLRIDQGGLQAGGSYLAERCLPQRNDSYLQLTCCCTGCTCMAACHHLSRHRGRYLCAAVQAGHS